MPTLLAHAAKAARYVAGHVCKPGAVPYFRAINREVA